MNRRIDTLGPHQNHHDRLDHWRTEKLILLLLGWDHRHYIPFPRVQLAVESTLFTAVFVFAELATHCKNMI